MARSRTITVLILACALLAAILFGAAAVLGWVLARPLGVISAVGALTNIGLISSPSSARARRIALVFGAAVLVAAAGVGAWGFITGVPWWLSLMPIGGALLMIPEVLDLVTHPGESTHERPAAERAVSTAPATPALPEFGIEADDEAERTFFSGRSAPSGQSASSPRSAGSGRSAVSARSAHSGQSAPSADTPVEPNLRRAEPRPIGPPRPPAGEPAASAHSEELVDTTGRGIPPVTDREPKSDTAGRGIPPVTDREPEAESRTTAPATGPGATEDEVEPEVSADRPDTDAGPTPSRGRRSLAPIDDWDDDDDDSDEDDDVPMPRGRRAL